MSNKLEAMAKMNKGYTAAGCKGLLDPWQSNSIIPQSKPSDEAIKQPSSCSG